MKTLIILFFLPFSLFGQYTVGLVDYQFGNEEGYILFSPSSSTSTFLIDKCGNKVNSWESTYKPGLSCYLLEDGSLLRTGKVNNPDFTEGGNGGIIEKYNWEGNLTWSYSISDNFECQHHDVKVLPNGNILAIVWEKYTAAEAIALGKNSSYSNDYLLSEKIIELQPTGTNGANVIWEWKVWDHLIQDFDNSKPNFGTIVDNPRLINLNYFPGQPTSEDWIHLNSIDYNEELDQILVSAHTFSEIWIIDHSTTNSEAASNAGGNSSVGGSLLYRWGNPQAYANGNASDKKLYGQHHATWVPKTFPNADKIVLFNNGLNRPDGAYSSIDLLETPSLVNEIYPLGSGTTFGPETLSWSYSSPTPTDFYSSNISGVYPLENGGYLITNGNAGTFFEINANSETVWKYISPITSTGIMNQGETASANIVFRSTFYPLSYTAFSGKTMTSQGVLEGNPITPSLCELQAGIITNENSIDHFTLFPNPSSNQLTIRGINENELSFIEIVDQFERIVLKSTAQSFSTSSLANGVYQVNIQFKNGERKNRTFMKVE